jgi:aspartyl-tRNA(Asn)/glutamyl-tRNA(Gln) amidotransferase subunit C
MQVTPSLIDHLAHLARLEFNAEEKETIRFDLERMVNFVDKLKEIDTTGVVPLTHMSANKNIYREDVDVENISAAEGLKNAPNQNDQYFIVPKVIKK